ncbi:hypothetical protein [Pseudoalteromonas ruthenica]|uniref:hypothetical protein n=1 Tax=Pseudoalteromonas ruthenica TaxID=151081 RepID=UPI00034D577E|nr:hypothetical protein [Pseudoalteromonas ruthenica]
MWTATLWVALGVITAALITRGIKISEFRQSWIDGLRSDISEYLSKAHQWFDLYLIFNNETEQKKAELSEKLDVLKYEALHLHNRICLRFKADDQSANTLLKNLLGLLDPGEVGIGNDANSKWRDLSDKVVSEARELLKAEWEATKNPLLKFYKNT